MAAADTSVAETTTGAVLPPPTEVETAARDESDRVQIVRKSFHCAVCFVWSRDPAVAGFGWDGVGTRPNHFPPFILLPLTTEEWWAGEGGSSELFSFPAPAPTLAV